MKTFANCLLLLELCWSVCNALWPHQMHEMWNIVTDVPTVWSVRALHEPLNVSRSCLGWRLWGFLECHIRWEFQFPYSEGEGERGKFRLLYNTQTTDRIVILFALEILRDPRHIVLDGGHDLSTARGGRFDTGFAELLWFFAYNYRDWYQLLVSKAIPDLFFKCGQSQI